MILNIAPLELLKLWGELVEAYYGVNGFGGSTAELYAYRFRQDDPICSECSKETQTRKVAEAAREEEARNSLHTLLVLFEKIYDCRCEVDGMAIPLWYSHKHHLFDHRVHVQIHRGNPRVPPDSERRLAILERVLKDVAQYPCIDCHAMPTCNCAFDGYNAGQVAGIDCLAAK